MRFQRGLVRSNFLPLIAALCLAVMAIGFAKAQEALPEPKLGIIITAEEVEEIRGKIEQDGLHRRIWEDLVVDQLPGAKDTLGELLEYDWPEPGTPLDSHRSEPMHFISRRVQQAIPLVAQHYLITGEGDGVEEALAVMRRLKDYERLGWFTWSGGSFPQINYAGITRVMAYSYDWLYDAMDENSRRDIEAFLIMAGRDYYRLNLIGPGMLMHHLRHHNQGNNAFASGLAATLATRDVNPNADRWIRAYIETYHWNLTHAFGQDGEDVQGDLHAYWAIAFDAVAQAAIMIKNATGADFAAHPHLNNAHLYWMAHLAPIYPVEYHGREIESAYNENYEGYVWVQNAPTTTPHPARVSNTMLFFARAHRDPQAFDLWLQGNVRADGRPHRQVGTMGHTGTIGSLLAINWLPDDLEPEPVEGPLYRFSERIVMLRSGLEPGVDSLLTFNGGQLNLIERGEQLGTGVGLVWHNPHFHYANTQLTLWAEGVDMQPSYRLTSSFDGEFAKYFSAEGAFTNTYYYVQSEQARAHERFDALERDILRVPAAPMGIGVRDYWIILDRAASGEPRAHTFTWNTMNVDRKAEYRFDGNRAALSRPKAALDFHFAEPADVSFHENHTHLMPVWNFAWAPLGRAMYAVEGAGANEVEEALDIDLAGFQGAEAGENGARIIIDGERREFVHRQEFPVRGGAFHEMELTYSKSNLPAYREPSWELAAIFRDAEGNPLNSPSWRQATAARVTEKDGERIDLPPTAVRQRMVAPEEAESVTFVLRSWHIQHQAAGRRRADEESVLKLNSLTFSRLTDPERREQTRFLTVLAARGHDQQELQTRTESYERGSVTYVGGFPGFDIIMSGEGRVEADGLVFDGRLGVIRRGEAPVIRRGFFERFTEFASRRHSPYFSFEADKPVTIEIAGMNLTVKFTEETNLRMRIENPVRRDERIEIDGKFGKGYYRLRDGALELIPDMIDSAVDHPELDLAAYRDGLAPWTDRLQAGLKPEEGAANLLSDAEFSASSMLDERFPPELVNDGRVTEAYGDGGFAHGQAPMFSGDRSGYGGEWLRAVWPWPYRVQPTYWLAADEEGEAWIEAEMPEIREVSRVRLLNTSNAGFNDRAMVDFRIDIFDDEGEVVKSVEGSFGVPEPDSVSYREQTYGRGWRFWFDPETPVPHGQGVKEIDLEGAYPARRIRVTCLRYWGYGAGLNEMQAY